MKEQNRPTIHQQLQELDELYYTALLAIYEAALQLAAKQLQQVLPDFIIAFAEIYTAGSERRVHGGMCHVFIPTERNAR